MINKAMESMLKAGECIDVRKMGKEIDSGLFELVYFPDYFDYCDAENEEWAWSLTGRFSQQPIVDSIKAMNG